MDINWVRKFAGLNEMDLPPSTEQPAAQVDKPEMDKPEMSDEQLLQQCLTVMSAVDQATVAPSARQKFVETMELLSDRLGQNKEVGDLNVDQADQADQM